MVDFESIGISFGTTATLADAMGPSVPQRTIIIAGYTSLS